MERLHLTSVSSLKDLKGSLNSLNKTTSQTSSLHDLKPDVVEQESLSDSSTMLQLQVLQTSPKENITPSPLNKKKRDATVMKSEVLERFITRLSNTKDESINTRREIQEKAITFQSFPVLEPVDYKPDREITMCNLLILRTEEGDIIESLSYLMVVLVGNSSERCKYIYETQILNRLLILTQLAATSKKDFDAAAEAVKVRAKRAGMFLAAAYAMTGETETRHVIAVKQREPFLKTACRLIQDQDFLTG
jgi:hypothetical protein